MKVEEGLCAGGVIFNEHENWSPVYDTLPMQPYFSNQGGTNRLMNYNDLPARTYKLKSIKLGTGFIEWSGIGGKGGSVVDGCLSLMGANEWMGSINGRERP
ncbi:hypothetical protein Syun_021770 [Stephania yunnanensis]|uniref:Uncharacterized protein n=1 Tax=Stephania yunnanensis TaxID=152371 RepID=A0AAP0IGD4_9MAGN